VSAKLFPFGGDAGKAPFTSILVKAFTLLSLERAATPPMALAISERL